MQKTHAIVVSSRDQEVYRLECAFDYSDHDACNKLVAQALMNSGYWDKLDLHHNVVFRIEPLPR